MKVISAISAITICSGLATAQVTATSPDGYLLKPGNTPLSVVGSPQAGLMSQYVAVDETVKGTKRTVRALHFRRFSLAGDDRSQVARKIPVAIRMAHASFPKVKVSGVTVLKDTLVGSWLETVKSKIISWPDWIKRPTRGPAPWTAKIPLDRPFVYDGKNAFAYHVMTKPTDASFYIVDGANVKAEEVSIGRRIGTGCMTTGPMTCRVAFVVRGDGRSGLDVVGERIVSGTHPALLVGLRNPNTKVPGLCAPILSSGEAVVPLPRTVSGVLRVELPFPHRDSFVGKLEVFGQIWTPDRNQKGIGVAGSWGFRSGLYPKKPEPVRFATSHAFGGNTYASSGVFRLGRAAIVGIE